MSSDRASGAGTAGGAESTEELLFWLGLDAEQDTPSLSVREPEPPVEASPPAVPVVVVEPVPVPAPVPAQRRRRRLVPVLAAVAVFGVVFSVYSMGKPDVPTFNGTADEQTTAGATQAPVDNAKVGELMKKISANPRDVAALQALADLYFQAGDYKTAAGWENKVLAIEPKNVTALLALGAAQFNLGDSANAERNWLKVVAIDPKKAEAHYDLGFLYLSQSPPNMAKVRTHWETVVAIDPTSDVAKTVATHLKGLTSASSSATPGTSGK